MYIRYVVVALLFIVGCSVISRPSAPSRGTVTPPVTATPPVTNTPSVTPAPPASVDGASVGVTIANVAAQDPWEVFQAIHDTGVRHVRLSAYYREPWALYRTIREAWVADSVGLTVMVDVQNTGWVYPQTPSLVEWEAAWDTLGTSLPPTASISAFNEPNAPHWWGWGDELLDEFWNVARETAHKHGRVFAGPELSGDWPGSVEWLVAFLSRNPSPDVLTVHYYGADLLEWMSALPWDGPVWLTETSYWEKGAEERSRFQSYVIGNASWDLTFLYDWDGDPDYLVDRSMLRRVIR
jgi:hypothetical protein